MESTTFRIKLAVAVAALIGAVAPAAAHGAAAAPLKQPRVSPATFATGAGTTVAYTARRKGTVTIVVQRRSGTTWKHVGRLRHRARAGRNRLAFRGKVAGRALTAARYRLVLRATTGQAITVRFRVTAPAPAGRPSGSRFLWGVSSSAFQSEGQACPSNWQRYTDSGDEEPYLTSVDFRGRYKKDIALAAKLGTNTFRFGINWACVEPQPGVFDEAQLAYYDDVVKTIVDHGMQPVPTFHHFVLPAWVMDQGAWTNEKTVGDFVAYTAKLIPRWAARTKYWLTFNEPVCDLIFGITKGEFAATDLVTVADRMARAHMRTYDLIHAARPDAMVSSNICESNLPTVGSLTLDALFTGRFAAAGKIDMVAIDVYYRQDSTSLQFLLSGGKPWTVRQIPYAMYEQLKTYHQRFPKLPLFVSESGMPTDNGLPRPDGLSRGDHLRDNVYWMQRAMAEGIPVIGYSYWSLTDNYEWGSYRPRFGLYTVDVTTDPTLTRRPTDAVAAYKCVIAADGVPDDYRPVRDPDGNPTGTTNPLCTGRR
ncbi:hypothetical protein DSM112329_00353 [Paraconexibacter sp. AEG42_29]|uniref:Glycosyl hydrolase family protein n=1 Tax=Paraconexibacter sp. AEG42_29 TaxID=2997339 RepID=A0AAU7APN7_9ACTN